MSLLAIIAVAVGLSMDAFAVAVAASVTLRTVSPRQMFRFAWHFGLFQALMPVIGWVAGRYVADYVRAWDHWVAFGLLGLIGVKAVVEAVKREDDSEGEPHDPTRGLSLIMFSVATSIDALAVGLSFAMLDVAIWYPCAVIGLVTCALTTVGMLFGSHLGARFGRRVEILGGLILIGIGLKILVDHTLLS